MPHVLVTPGEMRCDPMSSSMVCPVSHLTYGTYAETMVDFGLKGGWIETVQYSTCARSKKIFTKKCHRQTHQNY